MTQNSAFAASFVLLLSLMREVHYGMEIIYNSNTKLSFSFYKWLGRVCFFFLLVRVFFFFFFLCFFFSCMLLCLEKNPTPKPTFVITLSTKRGVYFCRKTNPLSALTAILVSVKCPKGHDYNSCRVYSCQLTALFQGCRCSRQGMGIRELMRNVKSRTLWPLLA